MEFRKLISFGNGSYVVSLPKDWVMKNKLKKGSLISVDMMTNSLLISTRLEEDEHEKRSITINVDNKPIEQIETEIITAYLTNYDVIETISKKITEKDEPIKEIIKNLAGLLVLEQTTTKITAKYLLDSREIILENLIRRMDNITRSLITDTIECIGGCKNYASIKQRDDDVNRLNFLVIRTVRNAVSSSRELKRIGKSLIELHNYLIVAQKLEKIADRQKRIARDLEKIGLSKTFVNDLKEVFVDIQGAFLEVMKAYYQQDRELALKIELSNKIRILKCDQLLSLDMGSGSVGDNIKTENGRIINESALCLCKDSNNGKETKGILLSHIKEHLVVGDIIYNLKAMTTSIKMIARCIMNGGV